ncbi:RagB/SusD family nutrient uptake outer membrane protein, partial [Flavobacterium sp. CGRL2]
IAVSDFSTTEKAQLQGEAFCIRGLLHFYLTQLFGDIPYIETTDYKLNSTVKRLPIDQVYIHIINDLKNAEQLLPSSYLSSERVRVNSFVAKALLARVYLYTGRWNDAVKMSSEVIDNNSLYLFEETIGKVFLKGSTEAIWQFMPSIAGKNTDEAILFTFTSGPPPMVAMSESLMNSFTANDLRKTNWTTAITTAGKTWYYASKYKESKNTSAAKEYSIILRLTEQYLIRAEANTQLKNYQGAREDLNKIRKRAGLSNSAVNTKEEFMQTIIEERRKELFTEYGHRFFDLKRTNNVDAVLSVKPGWDNADRSLPIPESEFIVNPNL